MSDLPPEPGLGRHDWETEYAQLDPLLDDEPEAALPELADLVERIMLERGIAPGDDVVFEETEQLASFRDAQEVAERVRQGEDVPAAEIGYAIRELREFYASLVEERRAP